MKVEVIVPDGYVKVDGIGLKVDLSGILGLDGAHNIGWNNGSGWVDRYIDDNYIREDIDASIINSIIERHTEELNKPAPVAEPLTTEQKIAAIRNAVGEHIEAVARSAGPFGFDSVLSAVSYVGGNANDVNVIYGNAIFNYREACWSVARTALTNWQSTGIEPTSDAVVASMPAWSAYDPA